MELQLASKSIAAEGLHYFLNEIKLLVLALYLDPVFVCIFLMVALTITEDDNILKVYVTV